MEIKATFTITPKQPGKVFLKCSDGKKYLKSYAYLGAGEIISAKILITKGRKGDLWSTLTHVKFRMDNYIYEFNKARNPKSFPGDKYVMTQACSKKPQEIRFWMNRDCLSKIHVNRVKGHLTQFLDASTNYTYEITNSLIRDLESRFNKLVPM